MSRALSIYLPDWPIMLARRRRRSDLPNRPDRAAGRDADTRCETDAWLLWTLRHGAQVVAHGCGRAWSAGVRPGMTLAQGRSLCAGLRVHDCAATPDEDAAALRRLARWMLRFAPVVSPDEPDGLLLDIAGCGHLFGGERGHVQLISDALRRWGLRARLAAAPTFACAWAVARFGEAAIAQVADGEARDVLASLPIPALCVADRIADALADVGVERIGDLYPLSRDDLAARFGPALLHRLDQATGALDDSIQSVQVARDFVESHLFDGPVRKVEIIEATTRELLARLVRRLDAASLGVLDLTVTLRRIDLMPQEFTLCLTHPCREHAHLWKLLSPRLERAHLGFGVEEISLRAARTDRITHEQAAFLREVAADAAHDAAALGQLVDCLMDRLGDGAVTRIETAESYVPERAFSHRAGRTVGQASRRAAVESGIGAANRPSLLFDTPESARVMSLVPDGPPIRLEWHGRTCHIVNAVGPERIVGPWWMGNAALTRDYYEVEDSDGRRLWVFRDGATGQWSVHGQWI